jgi:phosphatidylglycerol:prolipoprotein diacylglycerol transferase
VRGGFSGLLDEASQEGLVVTHWFDPAPHHASGTVVVRFSGSRVGTSGKGQAGDHFVHDETVEGVTEHSGPISVTARLKDVNAGQWTVTAALVDASRPRSGGRNGRHTKPTRQSGTLPQADWSWRRWRLADGGNTPVSTCRVQFAHVPGLLRGIWAALVAIGIAAGLTVQQLLVPHRHLGTAHSLTVTLVALVLGLVGAKVWFVAGHLRDGDIKGWCIQGLLTGFTIAVVVAAITTGLRLGVFLDISAPGMFLGMAIGRVGCFFAGCCRGRPTTSRLGIWSSDQRIGRRRVPTQLMESALALVVGTVALIVLLAVGTKQGAIFVAALAGYTLFRQGILRLRSGARSSPRGAILAGGLAAGVLVGAIIFAASV